MTILNEGHTIVSVVSGAGDGVKGAWVQMIASAARDSTWCILHVVPDPTAVGVEVKIDIGIGGSGSEVARISEQMMILSANTGDYTDSYNVFTLPMKVTTGDRVSIRIADERGELVDYLGGIRLFAL